jgi:hypothetical protein
MIWLGGTVRLCPHVQLACSPRRGLVKFDKPGTSVRFRAVTRNANPESRRHRKSSTFRFPQRLTLTRRRA